MSKFEVEISTMKYVEVEADDIIDAVNMVNELELEINDFEWVFSAEKIEANEEARRE